MTTASEKVLTQLRKGVLEHCVMAHLRKEPTYGLDLAHRLGRHPTLLDSEGTLYPLLARLRRLGLVETEWQESDSGPPRRYYRLSTEGHAALAAFELAWEPFQRDVRTVLEETR